MLSIALGVATMIISISIVFGFQSEIKDKIAGFEGHIQISNFDYNDSYEKSPIVLGSELVQKIKDNPDVIKCNASAMKGGIIKANDLMEGILLKGIGKDYNSEFLQKNLIRGAFPDFSTNKKSNEIIISENISKKLHLDIDSSLLMYFIQDPPRIRKFKISGIFSSGFSEFDDKVVVGDIRHIQKLNRWDSNQVSVYEITLKDMEKMEDVNKWIYKEIGYDLKSETIADKYPLMMDWLNLLNSNILFIIGLMILISAITMMSTFLILILEKTNLIGSLKAMGTKTSSIRKIFMLKSIQLIFKGLLYGNIIGLGLCYIQYQFGIIPLNPQDYYMNKVPIEFAPWWILIINLGTLFIIGLTLFIPSGIISKISVAKTINYR